MSTRAEVAWLARRAGWGLAPGELDALVELGTDAVVDHMVAPDTHGIVPEPSPWAHVEYRSGPENRRAEGIATLEAWIDHLLSTERPFENAQAWFWHDHFAVSAAGVQYLPILVDHLELLRASGLGSFRELIRSVTTDAAMLVFLDGATSTGESPNENYGRELLELYTMGIGNYTEDDVRAASVALTGWVVRRRLGWLVDFVPSRHDDTPRTFLGVDGVHDVDTVVDTAVDHPAVPGFIAAKTARHYLGTVEEATVDALAADFAAADLDLAVLARRVLDAGLDGAGGPLVLGPVAWSTHAMKATGARPDAATMFGQLQAMGQVPGNPPNVGGFPGASTWLSSSSTAARFTTANEFARVTPPQAPALVAAAAGDWDELADLLLRPEGFSAATLEALRDLPHDVSRRPGETALALALASPDLIIA